MNPPLALAMLALGHVGRSPALVAHAHAVTERRPAAPVAATAPVREAGEPRPEIQRQIAALAERFLRDRK
ncbi:MAG: hypothetical protein AB7O37_22995 [Vicinamibacteria bacterium]